MSTTEARAVYLTDGAYATILRDADGNIVEMVLTTGSHLVNEASDVVLLDGSAVKRLLRFVENSDEGEYVDHEMC